MKKSSAKKKKKKTRRGKKREVKEKKDKGEKKKEEDFQFSDPWAKLPSAWGGKASPVEEFEHVLKDHGNWIDLKQVLDNAGEMGGELAEHMGRELEEFQQLTGQEIPTATLLSQATLDRLVAVALQPTIHSESFADGATTVSTTKTYKEDGSGVSVTTVVHTEMDTTKEQSTPILLKPAAPISAATNGLRLSLASSGLDKLDISPTLRCRLVALNLDHNQFTDESISTFSSVLLQQLVRSADLALASMPLYLREITLQNNPLTIIPNFGEACHTLLALNLSQSHICIADSNSEENLRLLTRLRSLTLCSCGISQLGRREPGRNEQDAAILRCSLGSVTATLEHLDLSNNELENFEEVQSLICLKRLVKLTIAGNPVRKLDDYSTSIRQVCLKLSTLKEFNGAPYQADMVAAQFTDMVSTADSGVDIRGGGDDNSSCSCLEGNPCSVSYNCQNWARRYDIAKANGWKGF